MSPSSPVDPEAAGLGSDPTSSPAIGAGDAPGVERAGLWSLFVRVMLVQVVAVALLWLLQARFAGG